MHNLSGPAGEWRLGKTRLLLDIYGSPPSTQSVSLLCLRLIEVKRDERYNNLVEQAGYTINPPSSHLTDAGDCIRSSRSCWKSPIGTSKSLISASEAGTEIFGWNDSGLVGSSR